ncbi:TRAP transporter substrate-binding protein [Roseovarius indicus]|uniref:TRAP transporter substrate-binding protein n=1 Tax=Roseovarius indicus TaxID=540747 RepID=UPI00405885F7
MFHSFGHKMLLGLGVAISCALPLSAKEFRIAAGDGAGGAQDLMGQAFVAALERESGGKHTGKIFLNSQLGSEEDTVSAASLGTLDFSILAANNLAPFSPEMGLLALPYMMLSLEDAEKLTQGPVGDRLSERTIENAGVRVIAWSYTGFRVLTNSKRPVTNVDDLEGLKIRVPKNEVMIETYRSWGINPTPMAWSEVFPALQQGVVDGQDLPYASIAAARFQEVQKYATELRYLFLIEPLVMSESIFQSLSDAEQQQIIAAGKKASAASAKLLQETEARAKEELVAAGMEITQPAEDEREFIERATTTVWPKFVDSIGGKEVLNEALSAIGRDPFDE